MAVLAFAVVVCAVALPAQAAKKREGGHPDAGGLYQPPMPLPDSVADRNVVRTARAAPSPSKDSGMAKAPAQPTVAPVRILYRPKPIEDMRLPSLFQ